MYLMEIDFVVRCTAQRVTLLCDAHRGDCLGGVMQLEQLTPQHDVHCGDSLSVSGVLNNEQCGDSLSDVLNNVAIHLAV